MNNILNKYIVPVVYNEKDKYGILTSSSTNREGFIVLEDIYGHISIDIP